MTAQAATASAPWYRHRWPWILIAGPAIVVVAAAVTLWLAVRSDDGLVADDYYKQGLGINRALARAERAAELGIVAHLAVGPGGDVVVRIDGSGQLAAPSDLRVAFLRPMQRGADVRATLVRAPDGRYEGRVPVLAPGRWQVVLETDAWRLPPVDASAPLDTLTLRPAPRER